MAFQVLPVEQRIFGCNHFILLSSLSVTAQKMSIVRLILTPIAYLALDRFTSFHAAGVTLLVTWLIDGKWTYKALSLAAASLLKNFDNPPLGLIWIGITAYRYYLLNYFCWSEYFIVWSTISFFGPLFIHCQDATTDDDFLTNVAQAETSLLSYLVIHLSIRIFSLPQKIQLGIFTLLGALALAWMGLSETVKLATTLRTWSLWGKSRRYWPRFLLLALRNDILVRIEQWEQNNKDWIRHSNHFLSPYEYKPLSSKGNSIRLLKIHRTVPTAELQCSLESFPLEAAPCYEALSYTWGLATPSIPLRIDGSRMFVGDIVHNFIWRQRSWLRATFVWIDSICIDQSNKEEKTHQVRLMQEIYAKSSRVIVWLESPPNRGDFQYLWPFFQAAIQNKIHPTITNSYESLIVHFQNSGLTDGLDKALCILRVLFNNPYFQRIWIVQEVVMGTTIHIRCGDMCFNWELFEVAAMLLVTNRQLSGNLHAAGNSLSASTFRAGQDAGRGVSNVLSISAIRRSKRVAAPKDLQTVSSLLAHTAQWFLATNPRDKVFAMLGLSKDFSPSSPFSTLLNYQLSTEEVFIQTAKVFITTGEWPLMLHFAGRGYDQRELQIASADHDRRTECTICGSLPSWVPDWSCQKRGLTALDDRFLRPINGLQIPKLVDNSIELRASAICTVQHLGPKVAFPNYRESSTSIGFMELSRAKIKEWYYQSRQLARSYAAVARYGQSIVDQEFWRVCMAKSNDQSEKYLSDARKVWENYLFLGQAELIHSLMESSEARWNLHNMPNVMNGSFAKTVTGKRFAILESGLMALVPPRTKVGDQIYRVFGALTPLVVRMKSDGVFELVGSSHVHREGEFLALRSNVIRLE